MYLTYEEYVTLGGTVSEEDFPSYLRKASGVIDYLTRSFYKVVDLEADWPIRKDNFKAAIVAQMEYFNNSGSANSYDLVQASNVTIGRTNVNFGVTQARRQSTLYPDEVFLLLSITGLLFSGVCSV